jgi:hypothetical protein
MYSIPITSDNCKSTPLTTPVMSAGSGALRRKGAFREFFLDAGDRRSPLRWWMSDLVVFLCFCRGDFLSPVLSARSGDLFIYVMDRCPRLALVMSMLLLQCQILMALLGYYLHTILISSD